MQERQQFHMEQIKAAENRARSQAQQMFYQQQSQENRLHQHLTNASPAVPAASQIPPIAQQITPHMPMRPPSQLTSKVQTQSHPVMTQQQQPQIPQPHSQHQSQPAISM